MPVGRRRLRVSEVGLPVGDLVRPRVSPAQRAGLSCFRRLAARQRPQEGIEIEDKGWEYLLGNAYGVHVRPQPPRSIVHRRPSCFADIPVASLVSSIRLQPLFVRIVAEVSSAGMHRGVARLAKRDQVLLSIIPGVATKFLMVDLEVRHCAAGLASPAVPTQNLLAQLVVHLHRELQASALGSNTSHDAFSVTWWRNARLSSPVRNLKNRKADCKRTREFSFSRFAPAKKSAQIISRQ